MHTLPLGKHNPKLVELRKAIQNAELTSDGLLPIEGPKLLDEAVRSGIDISEVFIRRGVVLTAALNGNVTVYELDEAAFKSIQSTHTSQGVLALVHLPTFSLSSILSVPNPLLVLLGRLQDPGNVGTILRVAEAFSATGCLALRGTAGLHNAKTVRASAGSVFRLPHVWNLELAEVRRELKQAGVRLIGTSPDAKTTIDMFDWSRPAALFVGNEGGGLSEEEVSACDAVLRIPQNPSVESLNSAIATSILLYEASKHERITL